MEELGKVRQRSRGADFVVVPGSRADVGLGSCVQQLFIAFLSGALDRLPWNDEPLGAVVRRGPPAHIHPSHVSDARANVDVWGVGGQTTAPESVKMKDLLVTLNQHGLLTINSQPAVNGAPSADKVYGWGGPNGFIYQKVRLVFVRPPAPCTPTRC